MRRRLMPMIALMLALPVSAAAQPRVVTVGGQRVLEVSEKETPSRANAYWRVFGVGRNKDEAVADATTKAFDVIAAYMRKKHGSFVLRNTATVNKLIKRLMKENDTRRETDFDAVLKIGKDVVSREWYTVPVVLNDQSERRLLSLDQRYRQRLQYTAREGRAFDRMWFFGKVFALLLACCALIIGYLKIEEKTKGYLTRWLGVALTGILVAVALGLFFCC